MSRRKQIGFTLIELLVVIAIIMLLAALLLPGLKGARERATTIVCLGQERQIGMAFAMYIDDHGSCFPAACNDAAGSYPIWAIPIARYLPSIKDVPASDWAGWWSMAAPSILWCPKHLRDGYDPAWNVNYWRWSYAYPYGGWGDDTCSLGGPWWGTPTLHGGVPRRLSEVRSPSRVTLLAEEVCILADPHYRHMGISLLVWGNSDPWGYVFGRHGADCLTSNLLFVDGHVESRPDSANLTAVLTADPTQDPFNFDMQ